MSPSCMLPTPAPDTAAVSGAEIQHWYDSHAAALPRAGNGGARIRRDRRQQPAGAGRGRRSRACASATSRRRTRFVAARAAAGLAHPDQGRRRTRMPPRRRPPSRRPTQLAAQAKAARRGFRRAGDAPIPTTPVPRRAAATWAGSTKGVMVKPFEDALFAMQAGRDQRPGQDRLRLARDPVARGQGRPAGAVRAGARAAGARTGRGRSRARVQRPHRQAGRPGLQEPDLAGAGRARSSTCRCRRSGRSRAAQGTGIAANPAVQRAAFSETLIQDGTVSDPIEIAPEPQRADPGHRSTTRRVRSRWRRSATR